MSHQPSTLDNVRSTAASAAHVVADNLDPADKTSLAQKKKSSMHTDDQGQPCEKDSYRDQLNKAANGDFVAEPKPETMVEKVAAYVPGLSSILGTNSKDEKGPATGLLNDGQPPQRPDHDIQVEEFIKDQYKSKTGSDMPNVGEKS